MSFHKLEKLLLDELIVDFEALGGADSIPRDKRIEIEAELMKRWVRSGRGKDIANYINGNWDSGGGDEFILPVSECMVSNDLVSELKYLWRGVVSNRKGRYQRYYLTATGLPQDHHAYTEAQQSLSKIKVELFVALDHYESALGQLGEIDERITEIRALVESGRQPKAKPTTDKRKVDEAVFWALIAESRETTESTQEAVQTLRENLEAMSATEIKKFQRHLYQKLADAAHWDLWALAYIARGGCGDDAFEYFRAWLVMQGKRAYELASSDIVAFAKRVKWSEDPQCEDAIYVAQEAYENKKFESMPNVVRPTEKMKGTEWEEPALPKLYPELVSIFLP